MVPLYNKKLFFFEKKNIATQSRFDKIDTEKIDCFYV